MHLLGKSNIFLSFPRTHRQFVLERTIDNKEYQYYKETNACHKVEIKHNHESKRPIFFEEEPFTYVAKLMKKQAVLEPDYLISCYRTYQLTAKWNPALYIKKSLDFYKSSAFSISGYGNSTPIIAINFIVGCGKNSILVCMEQVYDISESVRENGYRKADALSVISFTKEEGPYRLIGYDQTFLHTERVKGLEKWNDMAVQQIAKLMQNILDVAKIQRSAVLILKPSVDRHFDHLLDSRFPHVWGRNDQLNLGTADPFYTLEEFELSNSKSHYRFFFLLFVDQYHAGVVLLEKL